MTQSKMQQKQPDENSNQEAIDKLCEALHRAQRLPKYENLLAFLEDGFYLTKDDRYNKFELPFSPWCVALSDWFEDINTNWIFLVMPSQVSKTLFMIAVLMYVSQYVRGAVPCLWVHNNQEEAEEFIKSRLFPMLENPDNEVVKGGRWKTSGFPFNNSYLKVGYATTKSALRSKPARFIFGDEIGVWKESTSYVKKRSRTFEGQNFCGIFATTPPEDQDHHSVKEMRAGNFYRWYVPCPECGVFQYKTFTQLKFEGKDSESGTWDYEKVKESAKYQCVKCDAFWHESQKIEILNKGKAVCVSAETGDPCEEFNSDTKTMQINALYSTLTTYGKLACNFLDAKFSGPEALKIFITDELAEVPEEDMGYTIKHDQLSKFVDYGRKSGEMVDDYSLITAGVDVQRTGKLYYVVHGWKVKGARISGHVIEYGVVRWQDELDQYYWDELLEVLAKYNRVLSKVGIDATDGVIESEIYDFCYTQGSRYLPIKDAGNLSEKYRLKRISDLPAYQKNKEYKKFFSQEILSIQSSKYKNEFSSAMCRDPESEDAWTFPRDTGEVFFNHLMNEHRKRVKVSGKWQEKWMPKYSGAPQHWFSANIYSIAVKDLYRQRLQAKIRKTNMIGESAVEQKRGRRVRNRGRRW